jgi:hypothetical protein
MRIHKWQIGAALAIIGLALLIYDAWWHSTYGKGS